MVRGRDQTNIHISVVRILARRRFADRRGRVSAQDSNQPASMVCSCQSCSGRNSSHGGCDAGGNARCFPRCRGAETQILPRALNNASVLTALRPLRAQGGVIDGSRRSLRIPACRRQQSRTIASPRDFLASVFAGDEHVITQKSERSFYNAVPDERAGCIFLLTLSA